MLMKQGVPQILVSVSYSLRSHPKTPIFSLQHVVRQYIQCWHVGLLLVYSLQKSTFLWVLIWKWTCWCHIQCFMVKRSVEVLLWNKNAGCRERIFSYLIEKALGYKIILHLVSGFKGAGLWPFDQSAVNIKKCITKVELQDSGVTPENGPDTPCEILRQAIVNVIATQPSAETQIAVANAKKQCKCVQAKEVEVLTTPAV